MNDKSLMTRPALAAITLMVGSFLPTAGLMVINLQHARSPDRGYSVNAASIFPGFTVAQLPLPQHGLVVTSLRTDSEAEESGIAVGDEVTAIEDQQVNTVEAAEILLLKDPHDPILFHLLRNHNPVDVSLRRYKEGSHGT
jgi:S1-C subfamily serine protease